MDDPKKKIITDNESTEANEKLKQGPKVDYESDEAGSDGSASAFDETEQVNEDNFDDLNEK